MTNQLTSVLYETERWVPGYTRSQVDCVDTLVFTVQKNDFFTRGFLFYHAGGWLLWAYSIDLGGFCSYEWCQDLRDIEKALMQWIEDPY